MKRFRFNLEAVLSIRAVTERRAREHFGFAQAKVAEANQHLDQARYQRAALGEALATSRANHFRAVDQAGGMAALRLAERSELEATRLLNEAETARTRIREEWLLARRGLQVIERLEVRARQAHRLAADKLEQTLLDELGSMAAARVAHLT
jgi:flagellar protein FliJ